MFLWSNSQTICLMSRSPEQSCCLRPELFSGRAVDDEVDGRVEDEEQVVQVLQDVDDHGNVVPGNQGQVKLRYVRGNSA